MLISIVTGTYNRLPILQNMIESARRQLWPGIEYEFVIVDGGSTDGTLAWVHQQPDMHVIEHGELRGAIKAFCDGARVARGEYVLLANDDVEFWDNGILAAIAHLEDTPTCGAVAFADNRVNHSYGVQVHPTRDAQGNKQVTNYAQVGLFRKWLGERAGWWGDTDRLMKDARTYAGDNYLSSRVWEMGYTIDAVPGCAVRDIIFRDEMRQINSDSGANDSRLFYTRFANGGAIFGADPQTPPETEAKLRVMYLPIYEDNHPHQKAQKHGLRDALAKAGMCLEYDFVTRFKRGLNTHEEITAIARAFRPHVLLTQAHRADTFQVTTIKQLRADNPAMICVNWHGDVWPEVYLDKDVLELLSWYDLALVVNATMIPEYEARGIPAAYWQVASEEPETLPDMPAFDVLFLANCYSDYRREFGRTLKGLPYSTGLYGSGWGDLGEGTTLYDFATSHALMGNAKICIGDSQHTHAEGFVSNRFFETLYAGGFLLHQPIPGFDKLTGFQAGKHYATFTDAANLAEQVTYYMTHDKEREKIRKAGMRYCRKYHTFDARVRELLLKLIPGKVKA